MRLPRTTTRRLMAAVAVVALALGAWLGIERRRARLTRISYDHLERIVGRGSGFGPPTGAGVLSLGPDGRPLSERQQKLDVWHLLLHRKYFEAARRPWLPVPPDSPPPG